uniref:Uncharacterized protein n=1 Tax=Arundo donax TaxID=35708 RepID=A0A0A9A8K2_ARUDO
MANGGETWMTAWLRREVEEVMDGVDPAVLDQRQRKRVTPALWHGVVGDEQASGSGREGKCPFRLGQLPNRVYGESP